MDVLLAPIGSLGDVLPYCALGRVLSARGHHVAVAADPHFAGEAQRAGLEFIATGDARAYEQLTADPDVLDGARGFAAILRYVRAMIDPLYDVIAAERPRRVVAHPLALAAPVADEKLGIAAITTHLSPAILQSAHLPPVMPGVPNGERFPRWYKRAVAWAADRLIIGGAMAPMVNELRARVGLPSTRKLGDDKRAQLALFPEWFAPRQPDWPTGLVQTDFPAQPSDAALPQLDDFLDGRAIVFTPGSGNRQAGRFFAAAIAATARLGRRAILLTRYVEQLPSPLPAHVRALPWAPLPSLLRHAAALVHHGGIGTLAAALGAGVPQLVTPHAHDQPDNAARLERLGVAASLAPRRFDAEPVAAALDGLLSSAEVAQACRAAAARMVDRDGLHAAAEVVVAA